MLPPPPNPILKLVDDHYNHLTSFRCRYTEHYAGLGLLRDESGTLTLKKPGRMLWQYDQPPGKVFVLDNKFATFYTPGDPQAQRLSAKQLDDLRTPLRFLLGHTQLQKELQQIEVTPQGPDICITGIPQGLQNRIKLLTLIVTKDGQIEQMKLEETDGATTSFNFTDIHENIPTRDADFAFKTPEGVTVVNGTPPI